jgi:hypothetical protein
MRSRIAQHTTALPQNLKISVQRQSNSRGWLHRVVPRKRHQMRHLCDLACLLAKQGVTGSLPVTSTNRVKLNRLRKPFLLFGQFSKFGNNNDSEYKSHPVVRVSLRLFLHM